MTGARLQASRCASCLDVSFPALQRCKNPACDDHDLDAVDLSGIGTLLSYTVQRYEPPRTSPTPEPFRPFAIGWVALDAGVGIIGRVRTESIDELAIGQRVAVRGDDRSWWISVET